MKNENKTPKYENFKIESMDSLGQGVSKLNGNICFVPKSLPGEKGKAEVRKTKKNVWFTKPLDLKNLQASSAKRIEPECIHFQDCDGCHYLHTTYQNETQLKSSAFKREFSKYLKNIDLNNIPLKIMNCDQRLGYRNRIQLHYDKKRQLLGFKNKNNDIQSVPNCLIAQKAIQEKLLSLYKNNQWLELVKEHKPKGHLEIYLKPNDQLTIEVNQPYSFGQFTQVNQTMNSLLIHELERLCLPGGGLTLDLFGGNGNLSKGLQNKVLVVDSSDYEQGDFTTHQTYLKQNMYADSAMSTIGKHLENEHVENIIVDPPRSGLKNLKEFCDKFDPINIFYVSCDYHTQFRDISSLEQKYNIQEIILLDMFPSTYHLESLIHLKKSN